MQKTEPAAYLFVSGYISCSFPCVSPSPKCPKMIKSNVMFRYCMRWYHKSPNIKRKRRRRISPPNISRLVNPAAASIHTPHQPLKHFQHLQTSALALRKKTGTSEKSSPYRLLTSTLFLPPAAILPVLLVPGCVEPSAGFVPAV